MKQCSSCKKNKAREGGRYRYCAPCHAKYMREWRKTHPLTEEQNKRMKARAYAREYLKRGKLERQPCEDCGSKKAEMHHDDYDQPLKVRWKCRKCHVEHHKLITVM